jgi:V8-like Glu-specific endopeptidase
MDIAKAALGQRPSFLVMDNQICLEGSLAHPSGWENLLAQPEVRKALEPRLAAVGMIMDEGTTALGTGFVIAPNLVMTNRHIVEQMFDLKSTSYPPPFLKNKSRWYVNFSKEFGGSVETVCEAEVRGLGFVSPEEIQTPDPQSPALFAQADFAVLEIEPSGNAPLPILELNWGRPMPSDEVIVVVGHPCYDERYKTAYNDAAPMNSIAFEEVFGRQFRCKHAAPGYAREFPVPTLPKADSSGRRFHLTTNLMHDASTLGGNSGSPVISPSGRYETVGLHFWGEAAVLGNQITNLAHPFAAIADCPNLASFEANRNGLRMWLSTRMLTDNTVERRSRSRRSLSGSRGRSRQADVQRAGGRGRRAGARERGNRNR